MASRTNRSTGGIRRPADAVESSSCVSLESGLLIPLMRPCRRARGNASIFEVLTRTSSSSEGRIRTISCCRYQQAALSPKHHADRANLLAQVVYHRRARPCFSRRRPFIPCGLRAVRDHAPRRTDSLLRSLTGTLVYTQSLRPEQ